MENFIFCGVLSAQARAVSYLYWVSSLISRSILGNKELLFKSAIAARRIHCRWVINFCVDILSKIIKFFEKKCHNILLWKLLMENLKNTYPILKKFRNNIVWMFWFNNGGIAIVGKFINHIEMSSILVKTVDMHGLFQIIIIGITWCPTFHT